MFETNVVLRNITISENSIVMIQRIRQVLEDGKLIAETNIRTSIAPGEDYSKEEQRVKDICQLVHTPEAIEAYQNLINRNQPSS